MSDPITHTPYDLGIGVELGDKREADTTGRCFAQWAGRNAVLIWELWGAPKPLITIAFDEVLTLRVLDETWLSTETSPSRWRGIDGSFARIVEGGEYPTDKGLMNEIAGPVTHYQFVSMNDCVDVLALNKPVVKLIEWSQLAEHRLEISEHLRPVG